MRTLLPIMSKVEQLQGCYASTTPHLHWNILCISFFFEVIFLNITFCQNNAKMIVAKFKVALQKEVGTEHPSNLTKLQQ